MVTFIAKRIIDAKEKSLAEGQAKYRAYFIKLTIYAKYKDEVDAILIAEDCAGCIVTE